MLLTAPAALRALAERVASFEPPPWTTRALQIGGVAASFAAVFLLAVALLDDESAIRRAAAVRARELDRKLAVLRKPQTGSTIVALQALGVLGALAVATGRSTPAVALLALPIAAGPAVVIDGAIAKRRRAIEEQVHTFATNLANAMRTTANIGDALRVANKVTGGPLGEEVDVMLAQMGFGSSLEDALEDLARRGDVLALDVLVTALLIGRRTGGDVPRLMETTAASLREIQRLEAFAAKVMADPKRAFAISAAAPPLGLLGMRELLGTIIDPFLATPTGHQTLAVSIVAYVVCVVLGWRFVRVEV